MRRTLKIGERSVGEGFPTFVIAEIGCNHENDFDRVREMVIEAAKAGADAVKLQSFDPDRLVTRDAPKFWEIAGPGETQYEEFVDAKPRFTPDQYGKLLELSRRSGIILFSTPSDEEWVDFWDELGAELFKISSMDITHLPLLRHIARKGKPVVLSTGASYLEEVREAVESIREEGNEDIILLHCTSNYPTRPADANLLMMQQLASEFPDCIIGYSDHTLPGLPLEIPTLAVAAGARVVEKHFTFDRSRPGYDHEISADYRGLKSLVAEFRYVETALGSGAKAPTEGETRTRLLGRRSLVAAVEIPRGTRILPEMLAVKRPGTGIEPEALSEVVGKVALCDLPRDRVLTWDLLE